MTVLGHISGPSRYPLRQEPATLAETAIEALATALQHAPAPPASPTAAHNCLHGHQQKEEEDEDDDDHHQTAAAVLSSLPVELAQQLLTALLALPVRRSSSSRAGCGRVCYLEALLLRPDLISLSLRHAADPSPSLAPASSASSSSSHGQQQQEGRGAVVLERVLASVWACCPRLGLVDLGGGCSPQLYLPLLRGLTASSSDLVASSLHTLCLAGCLELDDGLALHALAGAGQLQQLTSLDVSGCVQLSDEAVAGLLHAHGPRLRTLLLACLPRLTGRAWACLTAPPLPRLQWLSLRCCAGITAPTGDTAAAAAAWCCCWPELLGLDVTGVLGLGDAALLPLLLPRARALQALVLGETRLSEQGLQALLLLLHDAPPSRHHQQQPQARDSHRPAAAPVMLELRELDLSWAETLAWSSLGPDQQQEPLLSVLLPRCPHLTSLSLQCCQLEGGALPLLTHLPALTSLNLNRARMPPMAPSHPTEEHQPPPPPGSARGGRDGVCWPRLTWLDLSWCAQPSTPQQLLQLVRRHCPALQHLALQGFKEALRPADTFNCLLLDAPPSLRFLDCSWCDEVDGELARRASKRRPRVVVVDYYCSAWVGGRCLGDMGDPETKEALADIQL